MKGWYSMDYTTLKQGDFITYIVNEPDCYEEMPGIVSEVSQDHAIVRADGMNLWLDRDTQNLFAITPDDLIRKLLFEEMSSDLFCMAEYGDNEDELKEELINSDAKILGEYVEVYLQ